MFSFFVYKKFISFFFHTREKRNYTPSAMLFSSFHHYFFVVCFYLSFLLLFIYSEPFYMEKQMENFRITVWCNIQFLFALM